MLVAGRACAIVACAAGVLQCVVPPADTSSSGGFGHGGLNLTTWEDDDTYAARTSTIAATGLSSDFLPRTTSWHMHKDWHVQLSGVFVAPYTGNYRFWVLGQGPTELRVQLNASNSTNLTMVAYAEDRESFHGDSEQLSSVLALEQGERRQIQLHNIYGRRERFQAAVEMLDPPPGLATGTSQVHEVQRVRLTASGRQQVQLINVTNTRGGVFRLRARKAGTLVTSQPVSVSGPNRRAELRDAVREVVEGCERFRVDVDDNDRDPGWFRAAAQRRCSRSDQCNEGFACVPDINTCFSSPRCMNTSLPEFAAVHAICNSGNRTCMDSPSLWADGIDGYSYMR